MVEVESFLIAEDQISEEIKQLGLVKAILEGKSIDDAANMFDDSDDFQFVVEHTLIVVIDFLHVVNAAQIPLNVIAYLWEEGNQLQLDILIVLDQRHQELVA